MKNKKLYLASQSPSRKQLLCDAGFEFDTIANTADESTLIRDGILLEQLTQQLAALKMTHISLPSGSSEGERCFVITADTMGTDVHGKINGKPRDFQDAVRMLEAIKSGSVCSTGFCIDRKIWNGIAWQMEDRVLSQVSSRIIFDVPSNQIQRYFEQLKKISNIDYLKVSGGFSMRGPGAQYVKEIRGSYTAILGLPMYEVRCALEYLGYFSVA